MTTTIRLLDLDGTLYFPHGGQPDNESLHYTVDRDTPSLLLLTYDAGDCDTVPWPLPPTLHSRLARALFDERECNDFFPSGAVIELPDGTPFPF